MTQFAGWRSALVALATLAGVASALDVDAQPAPAGGCLDGRVRIEGHLSDDFRVALDEVCSRLEGADDIDPDVVLTLRAEGTHVVVVASLPDGRSAMRHVGAAERLMETVEALTVVPVHPQPILSQLEYSPDAHVARPDAPPELTHAPAVPEPTAIRLELGAALGGRVHATPGYVGFTLGGYAALRVHAWALALTMRWDPRRVLLRSDASHFEVSGLGVGFAVTRRWEPRQTVSVDFGATAAIATQFQEYERAAGEAWSTSTDARVGLLARSLVSRGPIRWLTILEADLSPSFALHPVRVESGLPRIPYFSLGVTTGIAWSPG